MKSINKTLAILVLAHTQYVLLGAQSFETRDKINLHVLSEISVADTLFQYNYTLHNAAEAEQSVWRFVILPAGSQTVNSLVCPTKWNAMVFQDDSLIISWFAQAKDDVDEFEDEINPDSSRGGFSFKSLSNPGIIIYYAEGWADPPQFEPGMATDSIPGYTDLTPYGPGVVGKTIGPVIFPEPFDSVAFVDTLLSYITQSRALEWITSQPTADKYIDYFDSTKYYLQQNEITSAIAVLEQVLTDAETDKTSTLTSEAYALIRFNTAYLIERLPEN